MKKERDFFIATEEEIKEGLVTDIYFERTKQVLSAYGIHKIVSAEFIVKGFPEGTDFGVFTGLKEVINLLKGKKITLRAFPEGTIFRSWTPVMEVVGNYLDFGIYETALLGFICQSSGIATKSARCKKAAEHRPVISFGTRRMHPSIAPMIERSAYIGGCDGVSTILSADLLGIKPTGTMPHALILIFGDTVEASKAFDKIIPPEVPRIVLIDTFLDEKFEAIRVAEALKEKLYGIRLDTPGSRRGDFKGLLDEVRWELNIRGFERVKIMVSGGINEEKIKNLNEFCDGYGVGTAISSASTIDFSMDIVEVEGVLCAKRGKHSGRKDVLRCKLCQNDLVVPMGIKKRCKCGGDTDNILKVLIDKGEVVCDLPDDNHIRKYVLSQMEKIEL
ncbi:MAG: nicotinate phosphoribosyltransferase [Proteobacteria bacterium]|nr:nicotinate phosphoribosyltransferase [Pseudomonadota bacterium]